MQASDAQVIAFFVSFELEQAEQVQAGEREQHEPAGQEALARDPAQLQDLVDVRCVLEHGG